MAFEGSFDRLLGVICDEDEGSVITRDCCAIIANLLKGNASNATLFREMGCVGSHVVPLLRRGLQEEVRGGGGDLWQQMLEMVGHLLAASTSDLQTTQTHMGKSGAVNLLVEAAIREGVSVESKALALRLLALLVYKHSPNRLLLSQMPAPQIGGGGGGGGRGAGGGGAALDTLMQLAVSTLGNSHQVNVAAALVFKCYLIGNVDGQQHIAVYMHVCICYVFYILYVYVHIYVYICIYTYICYIYIYIYIYLSIYLSIYNM